MKLNCVWFGRHILFPALVVSCAFLGSSIVLKTQIAKVQAPTPQAILVLGGGSGREEAAAQLAATNPQLEVWVSSGDQLPPEVYDLFQVRGVASTRVHLDYRATDTVTNFTTLVPQFKQRNIQHIYVVTSDFHMPRATVIATLVLGHSGIAFTPWPVATARVEEPWLKLVRDGGRSVLWIFTGRTGSRIGLQLQNRLSQWVAYKFYITSHQVALCHDASLSRKGLHQ